VPIDRALTPTTGNTSSGLPVDFDMPVIEGDDGAITIELPDGGVMIQLGEDPEDESGGEEHDANLAEFLSDTELGSIANELVADYKSDKTSRKEWEETYIRGLDLLGLKIEERTQPWEGACGVFHPMLAEAVVRFQAQAIQEIFPAKGPVVTKIVGDVTRDRIKQSERVKEYLNFLITERMSEYRAETERMLFSLPLAGSAFRKVYYDESLGRPASIFVPAEDFVVSYGTTDLLTCERATHVMKKTHNELRKLQVSGFYRDVEVPDSAPDIDDIKKTYDKLNGESKPYDLDERHTLLEVMVDYDLPGFEDEIDGEPTGIGLPYVITIDLSSRTVLSIRRNWYEDDQLKKRRQHFVQYTYLPGFGFYGFGLVHMVGGLAKSATSILRQLVDAGTLSNLPGGLKTRGLRIKGDDTPIMPGEFRDVDIPSGTLRDNISFLPYKEPSTVLYQLLGNLIDEGRRFASQADMKVSDMNSEAPVGTTLALLERSMKVMSAVQARLHASMKKEFKLISNIVRDYGPDEYPYETKGQDMTKEDFSDNIDVIPVSDPNAGTMAQRIMKYQAALQLAQVAPQIYDLPLLHRQMLDALGLADVDEVIPLKDTAPTDPVSENMNVLNQKPVKAFIYQDHEAHIQTHMAFMQDPKIQKLASQSPNAQLMGAALQAHIAEHVAFQYRKEIEEQLGVPLPPPDEPLPEDIEYRLSQLVGPAADQLLGKDQAEAQAEKNAAESEDPILQLEIQKLELKKQEMQDKNQREMAKLNADLEKAKLKASTDEKRIKSQERIEGTRLGVDIAKTRGQQGISTEQVANQAKEAGMRLGMDMLVKQEDIRLRNKQIDQSKPPQSGGDNE
jgi:hypothetical protein